MSICCVSIRQQSAAVYLVRVRAWARVGVRVGLGLGLRLRLGLGLGLGLDHWAAVYLPRSLATSKVSCSAVCTSPSSALYSKAARLVR